MPAATPPLSMWIFIRRSLSYFWRTHAAVGLGIAAATAVIVGALVVGDSVRGSLRGLVLDRLANIECLLHSRTFFDPRLLEEISLSQIAQPTGALRGEPQISLAPLILLTSSTVESRREDQLLRASQVQVLAIDASFLEHLAPEQAAQFPERIGEDEVVLNAALARELSVAVGDEVTLRVSEAGGIPPDNPLGRRDATSVSLPRQRVIAILPDEGIAGVGFVSGQAVPRNVFASLATLRDILDCGEQANAALAFSTRPSGSADGAGAALCDALNQQVRPKIEDYGLRFERHRRIFPDPDVDAPTSDQVAESDSQATVFDYYQLSSEELIMDNATSNAVLQGLGEETPTRLITYLANSIAKVAAPTIQPPAPPGPPASEQASHGLSMPRAFQAGRLAASHAAEVDRAGRRSQALLSREVPYSIVVGADGALQRVLQEYTTVDPANLRIPYAWINTWLAEQIDAQPGDWLELRYFEPETVDGAEVERRVQMFVAGIVPLTEPESGYRRSQPAEFSEPPTLFNDPNLTPHVPGVTDQDSISNWDLPFALELEDLILPVDDKYWNNHRLTPKVFMPYRQAASMQLFGSRFGQTTALRWPASEVAEESQLRAEIEKALLPTRSQKGLLFLAVRSEQLRAASGTTPFDMLFLSLSFFVIVAALLLVTLLFKLGLQQRTSQLGMLLAQGFEAARIRKILLRELAVVAALGGAAGILLGLAYARLMIAGLETWWVGAISSPFLKFAFTWQSLLGGALAGMLASLLTLYLTLRKLSRAQPLGMLRGDDGSSSTMDRRANGVWLAAAAFVGLGAVGMVFAGLGQTGMARAGSFFGSGMLLLAAALIALWQWLGASASRPGRPERGNLWQLAWRAICRNPVRSALSLGLLSVASFLIASMGVFQMRPTESGYGGFDLLAESSQPIYRNIASGNVRAEMIGEDAADALRGTSIVPMRARRGEDASCNNLFQVSQPTVLGVTPALQQLVELSPSQTRFDWAATTSPENPWAALVAPATGASDSPIPVILDQNTAAWSLKQGASLGAVIELEFEGQPLYFRTVGLLSNSVLQGKLMIGEANFEQAFPKISGYSFFLIRSDSPNSTETAETVAATLEKGWSDVGLDVTSSEAVLERLLGVQNTYISAFQSLGALGLLLGTFGLVAVQVRSVVERRRELALMQAIGFSNSRLAQLLTLETALLLGGGLCIGILCAAIALVPYVIETGPQLSLLNPLLMLLAVLVAGFLAASFAVRAATRQSVLTGLRSE